MKRLLIASVLVLSLLVSSASACTMIYAGPANTTDGAMLYGRSEDYYNSNNKLFIKVEAGVFSGEYRGCPAYGGGFTMTLPKETSYAFTAFTEDNADGICPECMEEADHYSYTEAGTNEKGVTVSGTETLRGLDAVLALDPYRDGEDPSLPTGIEETDIPTVILSQAATAREGLDLLLSIYDEYGCQDAAGLIIADQTEMWYVENCSGSQYVAVRMPADMVVVEPNMAIIGRIDLDDENVISSKALISTAEQAGTFVGDAERNIIDYRASYAPASVDSRLVNGLNYLNASYNYTAEALAADNALFTISNLDADGNIVTLYSNVKPDRAMSVAEFVGFYQIEGIGRDRNVDTSIFSIRGDGAPETATVEWVSMNNDLYNVFVPYYPMLTNEIYAGYQVGTGAAGAGFEAEPPEEGMYYEGKTWMPQADGSWAQVSGYVAYPDGWQDSYYWCFDALSNYLAYRDGSQTDMVKQALAQYQSEIYAAFGTMTAENAENVSNSLSEGAQALAYRLFTEISGIQ